MADPTISHGWVTAEPDAGKDVDADNLNDHVITGFNAAVDARVALEATLARNADNLSSGTVADARIASTIARDSEVTSAVAAEATARDAAIGVHSADTTAVHGIADTANLSAVGHSHAGEDITSGTVADGRVAGTLARDSEVTTAVSNHEGAANPHPTYLTAAEGDAAYDAIGAAATAQAASQPLDSDLTAIAAIAPSDDDFIQRKSGVWVKRTIAQVKTDLGVGNLTGDVTSSGNATTIGSGKVTEAMQVLADNTTQDVSTSKHGYAPKGDGTTTKFLNANGAYSTPAGGGISSGTSNPGSPSNGDLFYRTDLDLMIRYRSSGTRWVCTCPHNMSIALQHALLTASATNSFRAASPEAITPTIWLTTLSVNIYVETVNNGTSYWTVGLSGVGSPVSTQSLAPDTTLDLSTALNSVRTLASVFGFQVDYTRVNSAGNAYPLANIGYRYIAA